MDNRSQRAWKQFWDGTGKSSDPLAAINLPGLSRRTYRAVCTRIQELLDLSADDIVLNIGCGPGLFEEQLASKVKRTVGVDFSYIMVDKARNRNIRISNVMFVQATGSALPFAHTQFNKVLCYGVLMYFSEAEVVHLLREIRLVTREGSLILLGDIAGGAEVAAPASVDRALEVWRGVGVSGLIGRGTRRIRNEIARRIARLKRKWMALAGQYAVTPEPQYLAQYARHQILALAAVEGFTGEILEQGDEHYIGGRYHALLRVP